jgi:hypothetical protein
MKDSENAQALLVVQTEPLSCAPYSDKTLYALTDEKIDEQAQGSLVYLTFRCERCYGSWKDTVPVAA